MKYNPPYGAVDANASYNNGNPGAGIKGSIPPAAALEHTQREIVNALVAAGLVPSELDLTQLATAIRRLSGRDTIAAPLTLNVPSAQFPTIHDAIDYLQGFQIAANVTVTIVMAAGDYTLTKPIEGHEQGDRIVITGAPLVGAMPVGTDLAANGSISATRAADAATNLALLQSRFATRFLCPNVTGVSPSFGRSIGLKQLLFIGNGFAGTIGAAVTSCTVNIANCAFHNFGQAGVSAVRGGYVEIQDGLIITGNIGAGGRGVVSNTNASVVVIGNGYIATANNEANGISAQESGVVRCSTAGTVSSGNGSNGFYAATSGAILANTAVTRRNGANGFAAIDNGFIQCNGGIASNNGDSGCNAQRGGYINAENLGVSTANTNWTLKAVDSGRIYAIGAAGTPLCSPNANATVMDAFIRL